MAPEMRIPSEISSARSGKLQVQVIKASNLPVGDFWSSDPYVKLSLADESTKTTVKKSDLNPTWNENFEFHLPSDSDSVLTAEVWDKDTLSRDDFLGKASINLDALQNNGRAADIVAKLAPKKGSTTRDLGTLYLRLKFSN